MTKQSKLYKNFDLVLIIKTMKKSILFTFTVVLILPAFSQILYPAFTKLGMQPSIATPKSWGAVGNDVYVTAEAASKTAGFTDFKAEYYDGSAWSSFPNTTYKGVAGTMFLYKGTYYLSGNFKQFNSVTAPSGRFFLLLQLKGSSWDTVANSDVPDSLSNSSLQCINTGFYLLHSVSKSAGTLHKFLPAQGIVKTYDITLDPAKKGIINFYMDGKANTLLVYGNMTKLDGNALSKYYFTLYNDTLITPVFGGSGGLVRAAVDYNNDIYYLSEYGTAAPYKWTKQTNNNTILKYNIMITMLGYMMPCNGDLFVGPGKQVAGKYMYDWYLPKGGNTWYLPFMNEGNYGLIASPKQGYFSLDIAHGIWKNLGTQPAGEVRGKHYADLNKNCVFEAGKDSVLRKTIVTFKTKTAQYSAITDDKGEYAILLPLDSFTIAYNTDDFVLNSCSKKYVKTDTSKTDTIDIAVSPKYTKNLLVKLMVGSVVRLDGNANYRVMVKNNSSAVCNAHLTVYFDPKMVFVSAPGSSSAKKGKIEWNIGNINPVSFKEINFTLDVPFDSFALGDFACMKATVDTLSSEDVLADNVDSICQKIVYSYDPNGKESNHDGTVKLGLKKLTYFIHFQNEGNSYAQNVVIRDTLMANLNAEGFVFLGSSHPCKVSLSGRMLTFSFANIMLQAKSVNEPASKGWVSFELPLSAGLKAGDKIENKAGIYFDRNAPVITNTATTILANTLGVNFSNKGIANLIAFPIPTTGVLNIKSTSPVGTVVNVYSLDGKLQQSGYIKQNGEAQLNLEGLNTGVYLVKCGTETIRVVRI